MSNPTKTTAYVAPDLIQTVRDLAVEMDSAHGDAIGAALDQQQVEIDRLRKFIQEVADGHDTMICRLVRDTAKEVLDGR